MSERTPRRAVVTGIGVATPIGIGIEPFWDALLAQSCGIKTIESFDASALGCSVAGELPDYKVADYIPKNYRKNIKVMARDIAIAVICAKQAIDDAALVTKCTIGRGESDGPTNIDPTRLGVNIGAGLICADLKELAEALRIAADDQGDFSLQKWGTEGMSSLTPLWLLKFLPNMLACHVTIVHDAQAPSNTITCGEASSHMAVGEALRTIARGDADVCICGGAESKVNPMAVTRPLLWKRGSSSGNDHPESASRPFAADRQGTIPADGGGLMILESLEHAKARGARIYAEVSGLGSSCNTMSWTEPDPSGAPLSRAIRFALRDAGIDASDVGLLCPTGTGTMDHDASEIAAFNDVFKIINGGDDGGISFEGDRNRFTNNDIHDNCMYGIAAFNDVFDGRMDEIPALTTRGAVGNNGAGVGAIDFAAAVMAIHSSTVPASINTTPADGASRFRFVEGDPIDARIPHAVLTGTALSGGQTVALVIRKFVE